jgi:fucose 4-O-acetylase-like acetyltransferase
MPRIWAQAKQLASQTRPERNRFVDFVRAVSISIVVLGHWLMVSFFYADEQLRAGDILRMQPDIQWLTWVFQVMPMFFIVGGYSNAASLEGAKRRGTSYADWLAGRLHRLITPLLVLVMAWGILALILHLAGVSGSLLQLASRAALIPTWFLAIYVMVVVLAPATYAAWQRWGIGVFWLFVGLAIAVDIAFFAADLRWMGWSNYLWVWLAVHQLGYAWRTGNDISTLRSLGWSLLLLAALVLLVEIGPYPLAMVGSPDEDISNSMPPKVTLVVLGLLQFRLLLLLERPARALLSGARLWAATILVNSMIMTLYLWHLTVMVIVVALANLFGGFGLRLQPLSAEWAWTRPLWIATLCTVLLPVTAALAPLEQRARSVVATAPSAERQVGGAAVLCLGVALLARFGFGNAPIPGLDVAAFVIVVAGAGFSGLHGWRR